MCPFNEEALHYIRVLKIIIKMIAGLTLRVNRNQAFKRVEWDDERQMRNWGQSIEDW